MKYKFHYLMYAVLLFFYSIGNNFHDIHSYLGSGMDQIKDIDIFIIMRILLWICLIMTMIICSVGIFEDYYFDNYIYFKIRNLEKKWFHLILKKIIGVLLIMIIMNVMVGMFTTKSIYLDVDIVLLISWKLLQSIFIILLIIFLCISFKYDGVINIIFGFILVLSFVSIMLPINNLIRGFIYANINTVHWTTISYMLGSILLSYKIQKQLEKEGGNKQWRKK